MEGIFSGREALNALFIAARVLLKNNSRFIKEQQEKREKKLKKQTGPSTQRQEQGQGVSMKSTRTIRSGGKVTYKEDQSSSDDEEEQSVTVLPRSERNRLREQAKTMKSQKSSKPQKRGRRNLDDEDVEMESSSEDEDLDLDSDEDSKMG